jgi:hypothetical protein
MRGPLPLSDSDFAAVRASVLARIDRPRRPYGWMLALATSVVVAVLSFVVARQPMPVARPLTRPSATLSPLRGARGTRVTPPPSAPLPLAGEGAAKRRVRVAHHRKHAKTQLARIEIHTADPDVRIIWITN